MLHSITVCSFKWEIWFRFCYGCRYDLLTKNAMQYLRKEALPRQEGNPKVYWTYLKCVAMDLHITTTGREIIGITVGVICYLKYVLTVQALIAAQITHFYEVFDAVAPASRDVGPNKCWPWPESRYRDSCVGAEHFAQLESWVISRAEVNRLEFSL